MAGRFEWKTEPALRKTHLADDVIVHDFFATDVLRFDKDVGRKSTVPSAANARLINDRDTQIITFQDSLIYAVYSAGYCSVFAMRKFRIRLAFLGVIDVLVDEAVRARLQVQSDSHQWTQLAREGFPF